MVTCGCKAAVAEVVRMVAAQEIYSTVVIGGVIGDVGIAYECNTSTSQL